MRREVDELVSAAPLTVRNNKQGGINGQPVHFAFSDDQTRPQVSVQLATARSPMIITSVY